MPAPDGNAPTWQARFALHPPPDGSATKTGRAARAGEEGRGFAVVAAEMRMLAEQLLAPISLIPNESITHKTIHLLGDIPADVDGFGTFWNARRERLREKIGALLNVGPHTTEQSPAAAAASMKL